MLTKPDIKSRVYPETAIVGRSRCDGELHFYTRVRAALGWGDADVKPTMLDVGCGLGRWHWTDSFYFRRMPAAILGIDVDPKAADNPGIHEFRRIDPECPYGWPVESESIDLIVCDYVLEHVDRPAGFMQEVERVLKAGGIFAARTPNKWFYVCCIARLVPNRFHHYLVPRDKEEVYPTRYRANTARRLRRLLREAELSGTVYTIESEPRYLERCSWLYRIMSVVHRWLPDCLRSTLICFARKDG